MNGGMTASLAVKSVLHKPLHELTEDDISQLTREDCRRFLKEKGMRRPSWNKSQAIQQVISLKSLIEPSPPSAAVKSSFRRPPLTSPTVNNAVNSYSSSSVHEPSPAEADGSVTALVEDRCPNQPEAPSVYNSAREGECRSNATQRGHDRCKDTPNLQFDQMTSVHSSKVNVYDGVPLDKMIQQSHTMIHRAASRIQFCQDEPSENLPNLNTCRLPCPSVRVNLDTPAAPTSQSMLPVRFAGKIADSIYHRPEGNNHHEQDVESQANRQASLQRYLEKKKDRGKFKMKKKSGTSSPSMEMYLSHQMNTPVISRQNSESNTGATGQLGVTQTGYETKEKHLKNPGLSVDLNDKA